MRVPHGGEEALTTSSGQLVRNSLGDKAASVSLEPIDALDEIRGEGDRNAFSRGHGVSVMLSMIILKLDRRTRVRDWSARTLACALVGAYRRLTSGRRKMADLLAMPGSENIELEVPRRRDLPRAANLD